MIAACPFCVTGRPELVEDLNGAQWIRCERCCATGPIAESAADAVHRWNLAKRRPRSQSAYVVRIW